VSLLPGILDAGFAYRLARERVLLAGTGMAGTKDVGGRTEHSVVLPGGYMVLFRENASGGTGQIRYPDGRPLSTVMDLSGPDAFASFMHNVDCSIMHMLPKFPASGFALADAIVETMPAPEGREPYVDLPDVEGGWAMPEAARAHLEARQAALPGISAQADAFLAGEGFLTYGNREVSSLVRWNMQVDAWIMRKNGLVPQEWPVLDHTWRRLETGTSIAGAARAVGQMEGHVLRNGKGMTDSELRRFLRMILTHADRYEWESTIEEGIEFYALMGPSGRIQVLASVETGTGRAMVWGRPDWVRKTPSADAETIIEFLKDEVVGFGGPARPRP
jgi:hypothetical protein